jgi:glutaredoxin-like protein NrdH
MKQIIVYTTPYCPGCIKTKDSLSRNKINYELVDISIDEGAREYLISKGITSVPCIRVINDNGSEEIFNMANEDINSLLRRLR